MSDHGIETMGRVELFAIILTTQWSCHCTNIVFCPSKAPRNLVSLYLPETGSTSLLLSTRNVLFPHKAATFPNFPPTFTLCSLKVKMIHY